MKEHKYVRSLISCKTFTAEQKLLLGLIMESELIRFTNKRFSTSKFPCKLTATQIGKMIGASRLKTTALIDGLVNKGWMNTIKHPKHWARETQLTDKFYQEIGLLK